MLTRLQPNKRNHAKMGPGASGMVQLVMHRVLAPLCALVLVSIPLTKPVVASGLPEPTAWMPSTASFIAYVDTASLFSSSIFSGLEQDLSSQVGQKDLEEFRELTGMDPWRDFDAISVFTETPENERERWGPSDLGRLRSRARHRHARRAGACQAAGAPRDVVVHCRRAHAIDNPLRPASRPRFSG